MTNANSGIAAGLGGTAAADDQQKGDHIFPLLKKKYNNNNNNTCAINTIFGLEYEYSISSYIFRFIYFAILSSENFECFRILINDEVKQIFEMTKKKKYFWM